MNKNHFSRFCYLQSSTIYTSYNSLRTTWNIILRYLIVIYYWLLNTKTNKSWNGQICSFKLWLFIFIGCFTKPCFHIKQYFNLFLYEIKYLYFSAFWQCFIFISLINFVIYLIKLLVLTKSQSTSSGNSTTTHKPISFMLWFGFP